MKTALVEISIKYLLRCNNDWPDTPEAVEFYLNESSHCLGNEIEDLAESERRGPPNTCDTCHRAQGKFIRWATEDDELQYRLRDKEHASREERQDQKGPK